MQFQVQAEAAAEEKLALLAELRQEKQNQLDSPATDALLAMIDDQPEPETVSEIANKIVQRMDEDRWLDEKTFRLSRQVVTPSSNYSTICLDANWKIERT